MITRRCAVVLFTLVTLVLFAQLNSQVSFFWGTSLDVMATDVMATDNIATDARHEKYQKLTETQQSRESDQDEVGTTVRPPPLVSQTCRMSVRTNHLRDTCSRRQWTSPRIDWDGLNDRLAMFIVDDRHKLMYCMIPKAATHTFRVLLGGIAGASLSVQTLYPIEAYLNNTGFRLLQVLPPDEITHILKTYHKVITVRHPLDRLRAVYGNKLTTPGGLNRQLLLRNVPIINKYLRSINPEHVNFNPWNDTLTFDQYLHLVSHEFESGFTDEHWLPVDELCQVCDVMYDAVYHVETLDSDMVQFHKYLKSVGGEIPDHMVPQNAALTANPNVKLHMTTDAYADVSPKILRKLLSIYKKDFELFGYRWRDKKGATCEINYGGGQSCC